jgi:hypothetical protein
VGLRFFGARSVMLGVGMLAAAVTAMAGAAAPAHAALGISCPYPTSKPFMSPPWRDGTSYALAPGGDFETGAAGWTLTGGARVVAGNESFDVGGPGQTHSLSLPAGSSATSPPMCIGVLSDGMRLFTSNTGKSASKLRVQVIYGGGAGALLGAVGVTLGISDVQNLTSTGAWERSENTPMLGGIVPLLTSNVRFRITPLDTTGNWRIDDVYLDPLMHR